MGGGCLTRGIARLDSDDKCIISLLRNKNHAIITAEGIISGTTDKVWLEVYDFLPKGILEGSSDLKIESITQAFSIIFKNPSTDGQVRFNKIEDTSLLESEEVWKTFKFKDDGIDAEYQYWECRFSDYLKMKFSIEKDIKDPPMFALAGNDRIFGATGHNCYTWAKSKLELIGITLETSIWDKLIAAEPQKHIQPNNRSCVLI